MAVRASLACFPSDPALHAACGMPWGVAITPFSATDERGFPPATGTEGHLLPRCQSCFAYFNLLCPLDRWSWNCAICGAENDLSADAAARYARDGGHDPPEMRSAFVDLLLPGTRLYLSLPLSAFGLDAARCGTVRYCGNLVVVEFCRGGGRGGSGGGSDARVRGGDRLVL
jgi:hypothetical protein